MTAQQPSSPRGFSGRLDHVVPRRPDVDAQPDLRPVAEADPAPATPRRHLWSVPEPHPGQNDPDLDVRGCAVTLSGEFDMAGIGAFASVTTGLPAAPRRGDMFLNLCQLRFIDAAGLGAIVALRNILTAQGHTLQITGATRSVRRVFESGGLADLLASDPEPPAVS